MHSSTESYPALSQQSLEAAIVKHVWVVHCLIPPVKTIVMRGLIYREPRMHRITARPRNHRSRTMQTEEVRHQRQLSSFRSLLMRSQIFGQQPGDLCVCLLAHALCLPRKGNCCITITCQGSARSSRHQSSPITVTCIISSRCFFVPCCILCCSLCHITWSSRKMPGPSSLAILLLSLSLRCT